MAEGGIPAPVKLVLGVDSSAQAVQWSRWFNDLLMYFTAANITDGKRQRALLLYLGGPEVSEIYETCEDTEKTFASTSGILIDYFKEKKNVSFERYNFHSAKKGDHENAKSYLIRLKKLVASCDFDHYSSKDALIDQFISSCGSAKLQRKLLVKDQVDLEDLIRMASTMELVDTQVSTMEKSEQAELVNVMKGKIHCYGCGSSDHVIHSPECPASGLACHQCGFMGHFKSYCRNQKGGKGYGARVKALEASDSDEDYLF